jgi:hypothetical protein
MVSKRTALVVSVVAGIACVCCMLQTFTSPPGQDGDRRLSLLGEEQFDIKVPKGLKSGQTFLAVVSGHRERMVTVPSHVKGGQEISIEVPLDKQAPAAAQNSAAASKQDREGSSVSGAPNMLGGRQELEEGGGGDAGAENLNAGSNQAEQAGKGRKKTICLVCSRRVCVCTCMYG